MQPKNLFILVFVAFLWGCSNDDSGQASSTESVIGDFSALGEDRDNVYQFNYTAAGAGEETINLTQEIALTTRFLTLRQVEEVITFFSFSSGSFSAIQRNMRTGEARTLDNIYNISNDQSVIWGANSEDQVFFGYYSPRGSNNFGMRMVDIATTTAIDIPIEVNVQNVYEPLYYRGKLFVSYRDASGDYLTAVFDTATATILRTWDFGGSVPSFYIEAAGDVGVITNVDGNGYTHTLYDFDSLEPLEERDFSLNRFFAPGPLQAQMINDRLYYLNFYAQPALVPYGPAIYDFAKGENTIIDMIGIVQALEQETGENISLTSYQYYPAGRHFLVGYTRDFNNGEFMGGIMIISENGDLLETLETPFVPIYFIEP